MGAEKTVSIRRAKGKPSSKAETLIEKTIRQTLEHAIRVGASDVHIEPREGYAVVRQRVNGLLQVTTKLPGNSLEEIVVHIKNLAKLKAKQHQIPQAGEYLFKVSGHEFEIRVSILPMVTGERVTLHIHDAVEAPPALKKLGYWGIAKKAIDHALSQPHGLIVVAGSDRLSTHTSLTSMLATLSNPMLSMVTVEDKPLYHVPNAIQTTIKPDIGMTFARKLRHALNRQPNVIMISDIYDRSAATAVMQAATQHLVLAGVHAQDAITGLWGLAQLSNQSPALASTLYIAVGQHLTGQLCQFCREPYTPSVALQQQLVSIFGINDKARMHRLHELELLAIQENIGISAEQPLSYSPSTTNQQIARLWRPNSDGCKSCRWDGYNERITINEVIARSTTLQATFGKDNFSTAELRKAAQASDTIPLALDALIKALRGLVPIEIALAYAQA